MNVLLLEEHDDGSATYTFDLTMEERDILLSLGIMTAIKNGIQEGRNMSVTLIWATPNAEHLIAYMARVSNPENQDNPDTAPKLLKYLMDNKHWSPFEMVNVCMEITTTRDIARQILRHRSFSFQEFSQRYAISSRYETSEVRLQDNKNRQNSIAVQDRELMAVWDELQTDVLVAAKRSYEAALGMGHSQGGSTKGVARRTNHQ